jgi:tetratricopeptide (TPR) repeat protein
MQPVPVQKGPIKKAMLFLITAGIAVVVLGAAAAGFFIYNGGQYGEALACMDKQDFKGAQEHLASVASFYKDKTQLMQYAQAGEALQAKKFDDAKDLYLELEDYKDSKTMVSEADYQKASARLESSDFDEARQIFLTLKSYRDSDAMASEADYLKASALLTKSDFDGARQIFVSLKDYKDSATMVNEADYRKAAALYDKKDYKNALDAYGKLGDYKDSKDKLESVSKDIYDNAVSDYKKGDYQTASEGLALIPDYNENIIKYQYLIEAHGIKASDGYDKIRQAYANLKTVGDFEDAKTLKLSDVFLAYYMEGRWLNSSGGLFMEVRYDASKSTWYVEDNEYLIPVKFESKAVYIIDGGKSVLFFKVDYVTEDSCKLTVTGSSGASQTISLKRS